ncbi:MAG: MBL fold metallo-hydrolase [Exilispira sp.]
MKYAILGSGSKANSYVFSNGNASCIVDNGYSFTEFLSRNKSLNFEIDKFKFILVTHTHKDHINGVKTCAKKLKIPIFIHKNSDYLQYFNKERLDIRPIETNKIYKCDSFSFISFETFHDAKGSISYSLNFDNTTFTIITDTGKISRQMIKYARYSDILFLEANYNIDALNNGPYPYHLKKRIKSNYGHLSNIKSIEFLNFLSSKDSKIKLVYFCHLSDVNNSIKLLEQDISKYGQFNFNYIICPRNQIQIGIDLKTINQLVSNNIDLFQKNIDNNYKDNNNIDDSGIDNKSNYNNNIDDSEIDNKGNYNNNTDNNKIGNNEKIYSKYSKNLLF